MDFPKKQAQRLMPLYLLEYSEKLFTNHPDPSVPWGGEVPDYTAGQGITITNNEISVDTNVIASKNDLNAYIKNDDESYTANFRGQSVDVRSEIKDLNTMYLPGQIESYRHSGPGIWRFYLPDKSNGSYTLATTDDIPSLTGYATETWVQNQGYATSSQIPTNYVTTDTEQLITGLKTIGETSGTISEVDFSGFTFKLSNKAINHPEADIKIRNASYDGYQYPTIYSTKGLYVNLAKIKLGDDGNNTYGITMPDSSTWEADRVLATTNDIPSLDGYATQTWVQEQGYATSSEMSNHPFYRVNDGNANMFFDWDGTDPFYKVYELSQPARVRLNALNPNYGTGLSATYNPETLALDISIDENVIPNIEPNVPLSPVQTLSTLQVNGIVYGIPESKTYISGTGINITNDTISVDDTVALKSEVPSSATSTSTSTVTPSTIELVFTYEDNTTQTITLMTGATVSTSTTTTLS